MAKATSDDSSITEKELLHRVAAGDQSAFSILFHKYKQMVYQVAWTYTEDKELAEDILQDTFSVVWKKRETLTDVQDFSAWLYVVARNRSLQVLKKIAAERKNLDKRANLQRYWEPDHTQQVSEKQMEALLKDAMSLLSPQQRKVFELRRIEGRTLDEIAEELSISRNTVSVHLTIALRTVRAFLLANLEFSAFLLLLTRFLKK